MDKYLNIWTLCNKRRRQKGSRSSVITVQVYIWAIVSIANESCSCNSWTEILGIYQKAVSAAPYFQVQSTIAHAQIKHGRM